jgi:DNA invertase Pin-like site-specific DNA recombinase
MLKESIELMNTFRINLPVILYERVSSAAQDQTESGKNGLNTQHAVLEEFCKEHKLKIVSSVREVGSAYYADGGAKLLAAINSYRRGISKQDRQTQTYCILVYSVSRFSRNVTWARSILEQLHNDGGWVYSASEQCSSHEQQFITYLEGAQHESDMQSKRVTDASTRMKRSGGYTGNAPFGYAAYHDSKGIRRLRINSDEQRAISELMRLYTHDQNADTLAAKMNSYGYMYRTGRKNMQWTVFHVIDIVLHGEDDAIGFDEQERQYSYDGNHRVITYKGRSIWFVPKSKAGPSQQDIQNIRDKQLKKVPNIMSGVEINLAIENGVAYVVSASGNKKRVPDEIMMEAVQLLLSSVAEDRDYTTVTSLPSAFLYLDVECDIATFDKPTEPQTETETSKKPSVVAKKPAPPPTNESDAEEPVPTPVKKPAIAAKKPAPPPTDESDVDEPVTVPAKKPAIAAKKPAPPPTDESDVEEDPVPAQVKKPVSAKKPAPPPSGDSDEESDAEEEKPAPPPKKAVPAKKASVASKKPAPPPSDDEDD